MNKQFFIILIFIQFTLSETFAQTEIKSGNAEYILTITHDTKFDALPERLKAQVLIMEEEANSVSFCLNFNDIESSFTTCNSEEAKKAILYTKSKKPVHVNYTTNLIRYNNANAVMGSIKENSYIIEEKNGYVWQLSSETKVIDGYTCYKATTSYVYETKTPENISVIAWYCPTIPFHTGPNGYFGLPGLIMELNDKNAVFGLTKLSLSNETVEIEKPKDATIISKQDYNNLVKQKAKEE